MKNQKKQLIILLGILAVCAIAYFAAGAYADREEASLAETEYEVLSFDSSGMVMLSVEGSAGALSLSYDNGSWSFINDAQAEVNATTANTILGYLEEITSTYEIVPEEELSAYGLDDPSMTITVTMEDGSVFSLVFGDYNEMLEEYYFYVNDADTLYTMSNYTYNILNKSDDDLVEESEEEETAEEENEETAEEENEEAAEEENEEAE